MGRTLRSEKTHITNAEEYAVIAKERNPNVLVHYTPKEGIAAVKQQLDTHWVGVLAVPMTHQRHCYIPYFLDYSAPLFSSRPRIDRALCPGLRVIVRALE